MSNMLDCENISLDEEPCVVIFIQDEEEKSREGQGGGRPIDKETNAPSKANEYSLSPNSWRAQLLMGLYLEMVVLTQINVVRGSHALAVVLGVTFVTAVPWKAVLYRRTGTVPVVSDDRNQQNNVDTCWFSPDTWRGRLIMRLGLVTVLIAQVDYDTGILAFFLFLLVSVGVATPWTPFVHVSSRLRRFVPTVATYRRMEQDHFERLQDEEDRLSPQEARRSMQRQHAAFVGPTNPASRKPLRRWRAWGGFGLVGLGLFLWIVDTYLQSS